MQSLWMRHRVAASLAVVHSGQWASISHHAGEEEGISETPADCGGNSFSHLYSHFLVFYPFPHKLSDRTACKAPLSLALPPPPPPPPFLSAPNGAR